MTVIEAIEFELNNNFIVTKEEKEAVLSLALTEFDITDTIESSPYFDPSIWVDNSFSEI